MNYKAIKHIEYNEASMPESIQNYFCSLGNEHSFTKRKGEPPIYGPLMRPLTTRFLFFVDKKPLYYFMLEKYYEKFEAKTNSGIYKLQNGAEFDKTLKQRLLATYGLAFNKGYKLFSESIEKKFGNDLNNVDCIYFIFERVYGSFIDRGDINSEIVDLSTGEVVCYFDIDGVHLKGIQGGEHYKAWELILLHPLRFKALFDETRIEIIKTKPKQPELSIDLSKWNEKTYNLFIFFDKHFNNCKPKTKYICIWYFLEYETDDSFVFTFSQIDYCSFINEKYNIQIKKVNKPDNYDTSHGLVLQSLYKKFSESNLQN